MKISEYILVVDISFITSLKFSIRLLISHFLLACFWLKNLSLYLIQVVIQFLISVFVLSSNYCLHQTDLLFSCSNRPHYAIRQ